MIENLVRQDGTFGVMYDYTFSNLQINRLEVREHMKWIVIPVIAYGSLNFLQVICVGMLHATFITSKSYRGSFMQHVW